jgi:hypothetical protein
MNSASSVTIIINNYNYGRFLRCAIESALAQSCPDTEVIVVDDGSTDDSRAVMASYGDRITAICKENGGQGSAFNAGFARSHGSVVIFLDADDTLHPDVAERVLAHFRANPEVVRVQYRLDVVDADGVPTGLSKPPRQMAIPAGDLRQQVLQHGDDIPWLPTSGNAFSAEMLKQIFPMPEAAYRICADYYLSNLSPLFGLVAALDEAGGSYRVHGSNNHEKARLDLPQMRQIIARTQQTHLYVQENAKQLGLMRRAGADVAALSVTFLANRLISLRLDSDQHPLDGDTRIALAGKGIAAAWRRSDFSWLLRMMYLLWFALAAVAPRGAVQWLAEQFFYPESRGLWLDHVLTALRKARA